MEVVGDGGGGQDAQGFDAEVFAVGAVEVDVEVGDDGPFGYAGGRGCWQGGVLGGVRARCGGARAGETDGYDGGLAES